VETIKASALKDSGGKDDATFSSQVKEYVQAHLQQDERVWLLEAMEITLGQAGKGKGLNGYLMFCKMKRARVHAQLKEKDPYIKGGEVTKELSRMWEAPTVDKQLWAVIAAIYNAEVAGRSGVAGKAGQST
jgi:hypothetical protein